MSVRIDPLLPWVGGKRLLSKQIVPMISSTDHTCYVEPCVGMGGVFFRRPTRAKSEVINDINEDVITLFRMAQEHPDELHRHVSRLLHSRAEFQRLSRVPADTLTDIQRAARFILLQAVSFGGKVVSRNFGYDTTGRSRVDAGRLVGRLSLIHRRLSGVIIEKLDLFDCLTRYDRPRTLFYIDPPYIGTEHYYGKTWSRPDFIRLAEVLQGLRGRFILSINDCPEARNWFGCWKILQADLNWSVGGQATPARELIITN